MAQVIRAVIQCVRMIAFCIPNYGMCNAVMVRNRQDKRKTRRRKVKSCKKYKIDATLGASLQIVK